MSSPALNAAGVSDDCRMGQDKESPGYSDVLHLHLSGYFQNSEELNRPKVNARTSPSVRPFFPHLPNTPLDQSHVANKATVALSEKFWSTQQSPGQM